MACRLKFVARIRHGLLCSRLKKQGVNSTCKRFYKQVNYGGIFI